MDMAKAFHEGQMRRGNGGMKPYYDEHILGVYNILREECGITDEDILITALLHDTVEDTECTLDDIESAFGADIREQVRLLTRIQGEPFSVYARRLFSLQLCAKRTCLAIHFRFGYSLTNAQNTCSCWSRSGWNGISSFTSPAA
jgi:(p)ppGpp synthase/HD superfamily hydrolase